jgi:hypothetical protein
MKNDFFVADLSLQPRKLAQYLPIALIRVRELIASPEKPRFRRGHLVDAIAQFDKQIQISNSMPDTEKLVLLFLALLCGLLLIFHLAVCLVSKCKISKKV